MRNIFKNTWLAGLMLFSYLFSKKNTTKHIEATEEPENTNEQV